MTLGLGLVGLQTKAEESTLKWYKELQDSANQCVLSFEDFNNTKDQVDLFMMLCSSKSFHVFQRKELCQLQFNCWFWPADLRVWMVCKVLILFPLMSPHAAE